MATTEPTLQELLEQQTAIQRALAAHELAPIQAARDALAKPAVKTLVDALTTAQDELPAGDAKTQIGNVLTVLSAVPQVLESELARVNGLLNPPTPTLPA